MQSDVRGAGRSIEGEPFARLRLSAMALLRLRLSAAGFLCALQRGCVLSGGLGPSLSSVYRPRTCWFVAISRLAGLGPLVSVLRLFVRGLVTT